MAYSLHFLRSFSEGLWLAAPLLAFFVLIIVSLGLLTSYLEDWFWQDGIYYAFVTATTVGYGDFRPVRRWTKLLAVLIAFNGVAFTGIFVSIAVNSASEAFRWACAMA